MFTTAGTYNGNFGSLYFADYVCQTEATTAGLTGTWRAVLGDNSVAASSHVAITQSVYNTAATPAKICTAANFWEHGIGRASHDPDP